MDYDCPGCGNRVQVPQVEITSVCTCGVSVKAGRNLSECAVDCPGCGNTIQLPAAAETRTHIRLKSSAPAVQEPQSATCPSCKGGLQQGAVICVNCGLNLKTGIKVQNAILEPPKNIHQPPPPLSGPLYFAVSPTKLIVMSIATFGFYEVYWFYQNWKLIKAREQSKIEPSSRALFAIFFCRTLFSHIKNTATSHGIRADFSPGWLTAIWIIGALSANIPYVGWFIYLASSLVLLPVQKAVNTLNGAICPDHDINRRFTALNIITIAVLFIILILIGVASN